MGYLIQNIQVMLFMCVYSSTLADASDQAQNNRNKRTDKQDGNHYDDPCLELKAAVIQDLTTTIIVVKDRAVIADFANTNLAARFWAKIIFINRKRKAPKQWKKNNQRQRHVRHCFERY